MHALKDGIGCEGLLLAMASNDDGVEKAWFQTKVILDLVSELQDPRCGDALLKYIETKPHIHWQTEAATAMAEIGDVRAVPTLAKRLRMDPLKSIAISTTTSSCSSATTKSAWSRRA